MNTITFKEPIDFQKYQLILNFLENIGVEVQALDYELFEERETPTEEELRAVEEGLKDIEAGNIVPHEEVMQGARNIKKKRSIAWSHKANIQYYNILTFWAENNQSIDYIESIEKQVTTTLDMLISFPKIGKIFSIEKDIRKVTILRNFSIYYRFIEEYNEILILAFIDNRSNPKKLKF